MNANFDTSSQGRIKPASERGVKSWLRLDFKRSPDVIFAVGVGIIAVYYAGWGLVKLARLLVAAITTG